MPRSVRQAGPLFLALLLTTPLAAQRCDTGLGSAMRRPTACAPRSGRVVLDAAAIAAAGWHRVGEIVGALSPGSTASVDGFNHQVSGSRFGFYEATGARAMWLVRLDGQMMPMHARGTWILDLIPVTLTQLDSIVIEDGPTLVEGRPSPLGTIDLFTRRPTRASLVADYQHGDESGDPGPYRYTARSTPNVEKLGPFASGAGALGHRAGSIDLAARYASLNATDQRVLAIFPVIGQQDVNASGGSGILTFDVAGGRHHVIAGTGRFTGPMRDPLANGFQSPKVIGSHLGASGTVRLAAREWRYAASTTQLDIRRLNDAMPFLIGQHRTMSDVLLEAPVTSRLRAGAGIEVGRQLVNDAPRHRATRRGWIAYADNVASAGAGLEHTAGGLQMSLSARRQHALGVSEVAAVSVTLLNSWIEADHAWMDGFGVAGSRSRSTRVMDARAEIATRQLLGVRPSWYVRGFRYEGFHWSVAPPARDSGRAPRQGVAAGLAAVTPSGSRIRFTGRAEISRLVGDDDQGEASLPSAFAEGIASVRTTGNFVLSVSGRAAPATRWSLAPNAPEVDIPSTRRIDFSVNKWAWRDRVRAQLTMRNLLNAEEQTHPYGAQWNLRTHLAVTIALPSGAGRQ